MQFFAIHHGKVITVNNIVIYSLTCCINTMRLHFYSIQAAGQWILIFNYADWHWSSPFRSKHISLHSAGRYTGSYRIPVFIFLTIWIFKIPQYRCHLNNVWNATLLERGLFSRLHFGEDTAVCVTKRESSETEALVEWDEREEVIHISTLTATNIHRPLHQLPRLSHTKVLRRYDGFPSIAGLPPS